MLKIKSFFQLFIMCKKTYINVNLMNLSLHSESKIKHLFIIKTHFQKLSNLFYFYKLTLINILKYLIKILESVYL